MRTRYKIGEFSHSVTVLPGDELHVTITERDGTKQKVSEDINVAMTVTHWVMFYVAGVGFGGMFGGPDIGSKMSEIFVEPELVSGKLIARMDP
jgi:hypothetical protein